MAMVAVAPADVVVTPTDFLDRTIEVTLQLEILDFVVNSEIEEGQFVIKTYPTLLTYLPAAISTNLFRKFGITSFVGRGTTDKLYVYTDRSRNMQYHCSTVNLPRELSQTISASRVATSPRLVNEDAQVRKSLVEYCTTTSFQLRVPVSQVPAIAHPEGIVAINLHNARQMYIIMQDYPERYNWANNSYLLKNSIMYEGIEYGTVTNAMIALKYKSNHEKRHIARLSPLQACIYHANNAKPGNLNTNYMRILPKALYKMLWGKVNFNPEIKEKLLESWPECIPVFSGLKEYDDTAISSTRFAGPNLTGKILMEIRHRLCKRQVLETNLL
jgi:predicted NAD-dependent protein-ADP-ribosyltransferase YbiA (DUF1768 family)